MSQGNLADSLVAPGFEDEFSAMTIKELIAEGVKIRDELKEETRKYNAYEKSAKSLLLRISHALKNKGDDLGVDSFATESGTAFRQLKESYRVADWALSLAYMQETGNWQMLEKRVAKLATKEIHKATGQIPPGVDYVAEETFVIRRPNERSSNDE